MVEFVSANPTGPMHGNARGGALGDSLPRCLTPPATTSPANSTSTTPAIRLKNSLSPLRPAISSSIRARMPFPSRGRLPRRGYQKNAPPSLQGARRRLCKRRKRAREALVGFALPKNIEKMKSDLRKYRIEYDTWFHEACSTRTASWPKPSPSSMKGASPTSRRGALWYQATRFGAEKDEVLVRQERQSHLFCRRHRLPPQ